MKTVAIVSAFLLTACVTINIYFPAAAAEKAADEIIKGIQQEQPKAKPQVSWSGWQLAVFEALDSALNVLIAPAHAEADLAIDSADIRQVRASMQSRFAALDAMYSQGFVGIQADGLLTVRDAPISERNNANKLVAAENADRMKLYQAIANANGHPEWLEQIKQTFAAKWVSNAQSGWWYQASGSWKQK
ncbi:MAG: YdbL family protein [Methylococcaceae bacterium]|nr:YdbL family protein [Methylococcaceae bacterium]